MERLEMDWMEKFFAAMIVVWFLVVISFLIAVVVIAVEVAQHQGWM